MIKFNTILVFLLIQSLVSNAQKAQNDGGEVDEQPIHFGFAFQYISSEYKIYKKEEWDNPNRLYRDENGKTYPEGTGVQLLSVSSPKTPGFGLGFVSDIKLGSHGNLRFTPLLAFPDRTISYTYHNANPTIYKKSVQSVLVDFPLGLKLKSDQRGNFRAYVLGGLKYSADIISKKKVDDAEKPEIEKLIKNQQKYVSWETALGFDLYFEYFKMSPEIKFSQSIGNVLKKDEKPNTFTTPLDKLFLRSFQFSLYFE